MALRDGSSQGAWALKQKLVGRGRRIIRKQGRDREETDKQGTKDKVKTSW